MSTHRTAEMLSARCCMPLQEIQHGKRSFLLVQQTQDNRPLLLNLEKCQLASIESWQKPLREPFLQLLVQPLFLGVHASKALDKKEIVRWLVRITLLCLTIAIPKGPNSIGTLRAKPPTEVPPHSGNPLPQTVFLNGPLFWKIKCLSP